MKNIKIIRAWKDQAYRNGLTPEQRAALPENPAGLIELTGTDQHQVAGGVAVVAAGAPELFNTRLFCQTQRIPQCGTCIDICQVPPPVPW